MKTLAKQMIIERANKFYSIAERTSELYKENRIDADSVIRRGIRYGNQFKGYLQSMNDLELITSQEYADYLNIFCNEFNKILGDERNEE